MEIVIISREINVEHKLRHKAEKGNMGGYSHKVQYKGEWYYF